MKIRILRAMFIEREPHAENDEIEVDDELGQKFIAMRIALEVVDTAEKSTPVKKKKSTRESTVVAPEEAGQASEPTAGTEPASESTPPTEAGVSADSGEA